MATISQTNVDAAKNAKDTYPGTWLEAFLAGLPHLLIGCLIGISKLGNFDANGIAPITGAAIGIILALIVISILLYAWRKGWPLWSANWFFYGSWISVAVIGLIIDRLNLEDSWRYTNAMLFGWLLLCIIGYFALVLSNSKMHGLLSIGFVFPVLSTIMLESVPDSIEGWLAISIGLLAAVSAGAIIRIGTFRRSLGIVLGVNFFTGLAWAYISEYKMLDLPAGIPNHIPQFGQFLLQLGMFSIIAIGAILFPLILKRIGNFTKQRLAS